MTESPNLPLLPPYPSYRPSGLPWLGYIPAHWEVKRGKSIFHPVDIRSSTGEEELLTVSAEHGVVPRKSATVTMFKAESYVGYKLCWPGDLVINSLWAWARGLGVSGHHGIISTAYGVYRPRSKELVDTRYVHELVRSVPFHWELRARSKGVWTSRLQLTDTSFLDAPFPLPPLPEQSAIARYLDHIDRRVRRYIRAKRRLIELLNEQKQAIIQQAVTGQIDVRTGQPYPAYKDSGVAWLGQVPEHWEVTRLKFTAENIVDCLHATPQYSEIGEYPAIRTADISPGIVHLKTTKRIETEEYRRWTERLEPKEGDILYSREGERFGIAACVPSGVRLCISQRMMVFRIRHNHNSSFIMWLLNSPQVYAQAIQDIMGATAPHVNVATIRNYVLTLPHISEQDVIVQHVDESTGKYDKTISDIRHEIDLIREYRTRLIADVVTGKLDVREAVANLLAEEEVEDTWGEDEEELDDVTEDEDSEEMEAD